MVFDVASYSMVKWHWIYRKRNIIGSSGTQSSSFIYNQLCKWIGRSNKNLRLLSSPLLSSPINQNEQLPSFQFIIMISSSYHSKVRTHHPSSIDIGAFLFICLYLFTLVFFSYNINNANLVAPITGNNSSYLQAIASW